MEPTANTGTVRRLSDAEHRACVRALKRSDRVPLVGLIRATEMFSEAEVAIALELVLLLPFSKLAHAIYRPLSLFLQSLAQRQAGRAV